jgi:bifunctional enzyme CysN/CysC
LARNLVKDDEFLEVYVEIPLSVAEERDPKGLYKKARRGELKNFTGIDSPYEQPRQAEISVDTSAMDAEQCADTVIAELRRRGMLAIQGVD